MRRARPTDRSNRGEQLDGKKKIRNDRLVAVAEANHMYANLRRLKDLPAKWMKELQDFFVITILNAKDIDCLGAKAKTRHSA